MWVNTKRIKTTTNKNRMNVGFFLSFNRISHLQTLDCYKSFSATLIGIVMRTRIFIYLDLFTFWKYVCESTEMDRRCAILNIRRMSGDFHCRFSIQFVICINIKCPCIDCKIFELFEWNSFDTVLSITRSFADHLFNQKNNTSSVQFFEMQSTCLFFLLRLTFVLNKRRWT